MSTYNDLLKVINPKYIQLNCQVNDWEQAIRVAAEPLLNDDCFDHKYVEKIIEIAKKLGPYIVVAKHIAIPHAPTKFGAKKTAIGITTLKKPINFGNKTNDPVRYIFCLSAANSEDHIKALQQLTSLLTNEHFFRVLDTEKSPNTVIDFIKMGATKCIKH
jgi:PTS system ascorbate-specific IIA component